jgi:hypothetical protein
VKHTMTALDQFLPTYEFHEVHTVTIRASVSLVYTAIKEVTLSEMSVLVPWLLGLRALPARLTGDKRPQLAANEALLETMSRNGFVPLAEVPGSEVVIGMIGQPWKIAGGDEPAIHSPEAFLGFDKPDYARIVTNLIVIPGSAPDQVSCTTETRIHIPDPAAQRQFQLYWRVISIGSGLLRKMWLNAIKRRAEHSTGEK